MKNNQQNHIGMFMYLTQVKAVLSPLFQLLPIIGFLAPPFQNRTWYLWSANQLHAKLQVYPESIWHVWQRVHNEDVCGVGIP